MAVDLEALWRVIESKPHTHGSVRTHGTGRSTAVGEIVIAVDEDGARTVLFPSMEEDGFTPDLSTRVQLSRRTLRWKDGEGNFVAVTCAVDRLKPVFTTLAGDMLEAASGSEHPGRVLRGVLDEWRDLLSGEARTLLSRHKLVGLLAELLTLREVIDNEPRRDVTVWTGPDLALQDFRKGNRALEVKGSLVREGLFAEIDGLRQMEPPPGGELHLLFHRLEEVPDGDLTAPDLVREILERGVDRHELVERLGQVGYDLADEAEYLLRRFRLVERRVYFVDSKFPRIIRESFVGGDAPMGVMRVHYTVDLTGPSPEPLSTAEASQAIACFAQDS